MKVKSKPLQPRKPKTTFKLQTTLQTFKRRKTEGMHLQEFKKFIHEANEAQEKLSMNPTDAIMTNMSVTQPDKKKK